MKTCSCCGEEKPKTEFTKRAASKDGYTNKCSNCLRAYKREIYTADARVHDYYVQKAKRVEKQRKASDPGWRRMWNAWRYAKELRRVPPWANTSDMLPIYRVAAALGPDYVVDHIIPLRGATVSGLHVPENLQVLSNSTNMFKSNKFPFAQSMFL